jgi:hypothetical protein
MVKIDTFHFEGDGKAINGTVDAAAVVDKTSTYPDIARKGIGVVDITDTAHGLLAGDRPDIPNYIYIEGTDNYDGLRRIHSVPDVNSLFIYANYTAETLANTDIVRPGLSYPVNWEFLGYTITVDAAPTTAEDFVILRNADRGANFDTTIVTVPMAGTTDYMEMFEHPWPMQKSDIIYCTWANTEANGWGIELFARRVG